MRGAVHFQEFAKAGSCVDLRRVELLVTENRLQVTQVRTVFQHQSRHCMAKDVTSAWLADFHRLELSARVFDQRVGIERFTLVGDD